MRRLTRLVVIASGRGFNNSEDQQHCCASEMQINLWQTARDFVLPIGPVHERGLAI